MARKIIVLLFLAISLFPSQIVLARSTLPQAVQPDVAQPQPLNWVAPEEASVQLDIAAVVDYATVTYLIFVTNLDRQSVWDLVVTLPMPAGATATQMGAPNVVNSAMVEDAAQFSILELVEDSTVGPLAVVVPTERTRSRTWQTKAHAMWKVVRRSGGQSTLVDAEGSSGDIIVEPRVPQQVIAERSGDVPFGNYDITTIALQEDGSLLKIVYYLAEAIGEVGYPLDFEINIDSDCDSSTGKSKKALGVEHRLRYQHKNGRAELQTWSVAAGDGAGEGANQDEGEWLDSGTISVYRPATGQTISLWVPRVLLNGRESLCWLLETEDSSDSYEPAPPKDVVPDNENLAILTQYPTIDLTMEISMTELVTTVTAVDTVVPGDVANEVEDTEAATEEPATDEPATDESDGQSATNNTPAAMGSKIAVPLHDGDGYAVYVYALPGGEETVAFDDVQQPIFRADGQRLLLTPGNVALGLYEYDFSRDTQRAIDDTAQATFPFYAPSGGRIVFTQESLDEEQLDQAANGRLLAYCDLPSSTETEQYACENRNRHAVLAAMGDSGMIRGTHVLWAVNNTMVYKGCGPLDTSGSCGIFRLDAASVLDSGNEAFPIQISDDVNAIPTDTKEGMIAFMSRWEEDWEVYVMDLNGEEIRNVSANQSAQDGLATISPDGSAIAFVSNRDGRWAVWQVPITGGTVVKLFELPEVVGWDQDAEMWESQRISWGQ